MRLQFLLKLILLALLLAHTSACALLQRMGSGESKPTVMTSADGKTQLTIPGDWRRETALNEQASLQASNRVKETYVVLISDNKQDYTDEMTLARFTSVTREAMVGGVRSAQATEPMPTTISGYPALQYELRGGVDGVNVVYIITAIETASSFHQLITWTLPSRYEQHQGTLREVTQSFKEVGGSAPKASMPPASMPSRATPGAPKQ